jgi:hypothetical protein
MGCALPSGPRIRHRSSWSSCATSSSRMFPASMMTSAENHAISFMYPSTLQSAVFASSTPSATGCRLRAPVNGSSGSAVLRTSSYVREPRRRVRRRHAAPGPAFHLFKARIRREALHCFRWHGCGVSRTTRPGHRRTGGPRPDPVLLEKQGEHGCRQCPRRMRQVEHGPAGHDATGKLGLDRLGLGPPT